MDETPPAPPHDPGTGPDSGPAPAGEDDDAGHRRSGGQGHDGGHGGGYGTGPARGGGHGHRHAGARRIVREPDDRRLAGVCSGLADHLGVDVTVVRLGAVVLALLTPAAIVAYIVAAVVLPERRPDEPRVAATAVHFGSVPQPLLVLGAIIAVVVLFDDAWWLEPVPAALALIGLGVFLIVQGPSRPADGPPDVPTPPGPSPASPPADPDPPIVTVSKHNDAKSGERTTLRSQQLTADQSEPLTWEGAGPPGESPPPASPWWSERPAAPPAGGGTIAPPAPAGRPRSRIGSIVVALLLLGIGTVWLLDVIDAIDVSGSDVLGLSLVAVGVGLVVSAWHGRAWALAPIACVLIGVTVVGETLDVPVGAGTGERTVVVDTRRELGERHELFAGSLLVDLTDLPDVRGGVPRIEAAVGMGELEVVVPQDATVEVSATAGAGEVTTPGDREAGESGIRVDKQFTLEGTPGGPRLELDLSMGLGSVEVSRG